VDEAAGRTDVDVLDDVGDLHLRAAAAAVALAAGPAVPAAVLTEAGDGSADGVLETPEDTVAVARGGVLTRRGGRGGRGGVRLALVPGRPAPGVLGVLRLRCLPA